LDSCRYLYCSSIANHSTGKRNMPRRINKIACHCVANVTSLRRQAAVGWYTLRLTDVAERVRARPLHTAHGQQAVPQSPWVTTCVCMCEKQESEAKLEGQKWPKTSRARWWRRLNPVCPPARHNYRRN